MSLWTPYAQESALDLTKPAIKEERISPDLPQTNSSPPMSGYVYPQEFHHHFVGPQYPQVPQHAPCTVPTPQVSQESLGSSFYPQRSGPSPETSPAFYEAESLANDGEYQAFERDALRAMAERNGGTLLGDNPRMRRAVQTSQTADDSYRRQRERNNLAAKQSRDRRKLREMRLSLQATYLKKKVAELRAQLSSGVCGRCRLPSDV